MRLSVCFFQDRRSARGTSESALPDPSYEQMEAFLAKRVGGDIDIPGLPAAAYAWLESIRSEDHIPETKWVGSTS